MLLYIVSLIGLCVLLSPESRSAIGADPIWEDEEEPKFEGSDDDDESSELSDESSDSDSFGAAPQPPVTFALSKGGRRNFRALTLPTSSGGARGLSLVAVGKGKSALPMPGIGTSREGKEVESPCHEGGKQTLIGEGSSASIIPARKKPVVAKNSPNSKENREKQYKYLKRMRQKEDREKSKADLAWRRANGVGGKPVPKKSKYRF